VIKTLEIKIPAIKTPERKIQERREIKILTVVEVAVAEKIVPAVPAPPRKKWIENVLDIDTITKIGFPFKTPDYHFPFFPVLYIQVL